MPPFRLLVAAVLVAATAVPAAAGAAKPDTSRAVLSRAAKAAEAHWGAVPCRGELRIVARRAVPEGVARDANAWVTFDTSLGANDLAAPPAGYTRCTISLARSRWPTAARMVAEWDLLCMTMAHEYGHLHGHAHDAEPGSVMSERFSDYAGEPADCRAARPGRATRRT